MKSFNWPDFLGGHPLFSGLTEAEVAQLLKDEASEERAYPPDSVILREDEFGDSLFLIGSGSVQVARQGTAGQPVPLAGLKAGEFFGEVAVLERRPRSATVTAEEDCLLLEVRGEEFRKLLEAHPDMRSKVRAKMGERLGQPGRQ
jgi:CRP-like cAMP-binding protein